MLLPFLIAMAGFYFSYWSRFTEAPYHQHLHGLTATSWYLLLVVQPWLYNSKNMRLHRIFGFIGLFLAGGVVFSAMQVIPHNIGNQRFSPMLQYGLSFADFAMLAGFSVSVIQAFINVKNTHKHARWLISSALWALLPALSRLIYIPMDIATQGNAPLSFLQVIWLCLALQLLITGILIYLDLKAQKKVYSAYLISAIGITITVGLIRFMGTNEGWIGLLNRLFSH